MTPVRRRTRWPAIPTSVDAAFSNTSSRSFGASRDFGQSVCTSSSTSSQPFFELLLPLCSHLSPRNHQSGQSYPGVTNPPTATQVPKSSAAAFCRSTRHLPPSTYIGFRNVALVRQEIVRRHHQLQLIPSLPFQYYIVLHRHTRGPTAPLQHPTDIR
jgi:hypothetical protein